MKRFALKRIVMAVCSLALVLSFFSPVNAAEKTQEDSNELPKTVLIDGVERNVKIVTWDEYHKDDSGDFLVVISGAQLPRLSALAPNVVQDGIIEKIVMYVTERFVGHILEKGFEYVWNAYISSGVALKAYESVLASFQVAWLYGAFVAYVFVIGLLVNGITVYAPERVINQQDCVWSGKNQYQGVWHCIYRAGVA